MKSPSPDYVPLAMDLFSKLHADDSHKDVDLVASDGVVRAHACILSTISEPFRAMLSNGMAESATRRIQMVEFNVAQLKFIMRLLCTGGMDTSEWPPMSCSGEEGSSQSDASLEIKVLSHRPSKGEVKFCMKSTTRYRKLMARYCSLFRVNLHQVRFSVAGHELLPDETPASSGLMDTPLSVKLVEPISTEEAQEELVSDLILHPPLDLLFAAASFAKMYSIQDFLATTIERLKACINLSNFNKIMVLAIKLDLAPVRMAGLLYARDADQIRAFFEAKEFSPEVQFELQAIWSAVPAKKRRL